jgi:hypothetical protein
VLLGAQLERVDRLSRRTKTINRYVFPHLGGRRRLGQRRRDFRKAWKAGVPGKLRHTGHKHVARGLAAAGTFSGTAAAEKLASRSVTPQNTSTDQ